MSCNQCWGFDALHPCLCERTDAPPAPEPVGAPSAVTGGLRWLVPLDDEATGFGCADSGVA